MNIQIDQSSLRAFCRSNRIGKLSLFGSVLRNDFGPHSDIDIKAEITEFAALSALQAAEYPEQS